MRTTTRKGKSSLFLAQLRKKMGESEEKRYLFIMSYGCEVTHIEDNNSLTKADSHESFLSTMTFR